MLGPDLNFFLSGWFKMTVVEAYFGGKKMDSPDNAQMLSADVTSLIVEGIAQNTSGSIFEAEVSHCHLWWKESIYSCICKHPKFYTMVLLFEISVFSKDTVYNYGSNPYVSSSGHWSDKRCIWLTFVMSFWISLRMHACVDYLWEGKLVFHFSVLNWLFLAWQLFWTAWSCFVGGMITDLCSMSQQGGQEPEVTGSPTEKAILSWGLKVQKDSILNLDPFYRLISCYCLLIMVGTFLQLGMKFNETRSKSSILHVFPFNSEKKRGGVAVHLVIWIICNAEDVVWCILLTWFGYDFWVIMLCYTIYLLHNRLVASLLGAYPVQM